jgi:hypothetical protein
MITVSPSLIPAAARSSAATASCWPWKVIVVLIGDASRCSVRACHVEIGELAAPLASSGGGSAGEGFGDLVQEGA